MHPPPTTPLSAAERIETLIAAPEEGGRRLDAFLAERLPDMSRSRLKDLIQQGQVRTASGQITEPSHRVKGGEAFTLVVPPAITATPAPEAIPLEILYEDEDLLVLVKQAGIVVHPAPGHHGGTLVNALLAHCGDSLSGIGGVRRPGIVHRLDKDVSGVLVVAKHDRAHIGLAGQFSVHTVERVYEALVWGVPTPAAGRIDQPIGRHPVDRLRQAVVKGGKRAATNYRLAEAAGTLASRVELRLETGRTHQIRVHLSSIGHPILGDRLYTRRKLPRLAPEARAAVEGMGRLALHARVLGFTHPISGEALRFEQPPPPLFAQLLELLRA
ncbi:RluA family pseudouridine synthase [Geminicoccaceae bacterium 1502E]|nr:RluA family pseudouridine synthase [Geminicoccaceae bacterium 1502E]